MASGVLDPHKSLKILGGIKVLIVVCGLAGSGKTTLAKTLSRRLNIACIHKDSIKAAIHDKLGLLTNESFSIFTQLIEEQLANGVDLIVDSPFNFAADVSLLARWQVRYNLEILTVICRIDEQQRMARISKRHRHVCHHEADMQQLCTPAEDLFDYSEMPGRKITVFTDSAEDTVTSVLKQFGTLCSDRIRGWNLTT